MPPSDAAMTARAESRAGRAAALLRVGPALAGSAVLVAVLTLAALLAPSLITGRALERDLQAQIRATTGLVLRADGAPRFGLWPQPHLSLTGLHLADPSGTLRIDADALRGALRLLPLLVGRLEVGSATIDRPLLQIDLDGPAMPADSAIGRAARSLADDDRRPPQRLGTVSLVDGVAILRGGTEVAGTRITDINVTIDWRNLDAPATLTGTTAIQGTENEVAAWIAQPSSLLRGDHSAMTLRLRSPRLTLTAGGDLASAPQLRFVGTVSGTAPSLAGALQQVGTSLDLPAPFGDIHLASGATITADGIDLPDLRLRFDGNDYEGTLALRRAGARPSLAGTLACEKLSLTPFLAGEPGLLDTRRQWSSKPLSLNLRERLALDLRVSAAKLSIPPLTLDDAALSIMTRQDRTEFALVEGRAYGGAVRARASIGALPEGFSLRATGSLTDADAGALGWDLLGRQALAGTLSASANLESAGSSVAALMRGLHGWTKLRVRDGELSDVDVGHGLREIERGRFEALSAALRDGRTPFEALELDLRFANGAGVLDAGSLRGPETAMTLRGGTDVGARQLDLHGLAMPAGRQRDAEAPRLGFVVRGSFDRPIVEPDLGAMLRSRPADPAPRRPPPD